MLSLEETGWRVYRTSIISYNWYESTIVSKEICLLVCFWIEEEIYRERSLPFTYVSHTFPLSYPGVTTVAIFLHIHLQIIYSLPTCKYVCMHIHIWRYVFFFLQIVTPYTHFFTTLLYQFIFELSVATEILVLVVPQCFSLRIKPHVFNQSFLHRKTWSNKKQKFSLFPSCSLL